MNVIEREKCQQWYTSQGKKTKIQETQICAGYEKGGIDSCWVNLIFFTINLFTYYNVMKHFHC